jgi:phosphate:Na+ symporter
MYEILPILIGGLVLFILAITRLSDLLKAVFSERAKAVIERSTHGLLRSIGVGTLLTILLSSSSAVIILTIIFVNARTLRFRQAMGIVMGANIGTTFSSQLFSLDIGQYAAYPMLVGLLMGLFGKTSLGRVGQVILYFGMLFFGLFLIGESVAPLKESELFLGWMATVDDHYLRGALVGGLTTLLIQSSSGTVGIAIVLGNQDLIGVAGGIAIMLGAELGTCSDTLIATIRGSRQAIKTGMFHLLFNLTTIVVGLLLFEPFVDLVTLYSQRQDIGSQVANAHVLFNVLGVLLFLPLVRLFERLLNHIIPEKRSPEVDVPANN